MSSYWLGAWALVFMAIPFIKKMLETMKKARDFARKTNGIPMLDGMNLFYGHFYEISQRPDNLENLTSAHEKYGKFCGLLYGNQPVVTSIDLELNEKILLPGRQHHTINKIGRMYTPIYEFEFDSIPLARDEQWRRIRSTFAPTLRRTLFKAPDVVEKINGSVMKFANALDNRLRKAEAAGKDQVTVAIDELLHRYTIDMTLSTIYMQSDRIDFDSEVEPCTEMNEEAFKYMRSSFLIRMGAAFPILDTLIDWYVWNFHRLGKWRKEVLKFVHQLARLRFEARKYVDEAKAQGRTVDPETFVSKNGERYRRGLMDYAVDRFYEGKLTKVEFFNSSSFLLNASDTTSADALMLTLYHISVDKRVQTKLLESILSSGPDSEYLSWCIDETLRLHPPVSGGNNRTIEHDIELDDGRVIPAGTCVVPPAYTIHRLKEYWGSDADEFVPERWSQSDNFHPVQFIPFGVGPRACPGKDFALFQMKMLIFELVKRFKFEAKPEKLKIHSPFLFTLRIDSPIKLTISRARDHISIAT